MMLTPFIPMSRDIPRAKIRTSKVMSSHTRTLSTLGTPGSTRLKSALRASSALCGFYATLLVSPAVSTVRAQDAAPVAAGAIVSKIVVAQCDGDDEAHARAAMLEKLADHDDVEVMSLDDITFLSKRLHADPTSQSGRAKLASELGVGAWLDCKVDDSTATLTLSSADGSKVLVSTEIEADSTRQLAPLTAERMWASMGTHLSVGEQQRRQQLAALEAERRRVAAEAEAERRRVTADAEAERQRIAAEAEAGRRRVEDERKRVLEAGELKRKRLVAESELARHKVAAREAEAERQRQLGRATATNRGQFGPPAMVAEADSTSRRGRKLGSRSRHGAAERGGADMDSAPLTVSPATQRWLDQQKDHAGQRRGSPAGAAPVGSPASGAATSGGRSPGAAGSGISPATQRWLTQQHAR